MRIVSWEELPAKILAKTVPIDGCLRYSGPFNNKGYGRIYFRGGQLLVHRIMCQPLPEGWIVDHLCHNADVTCPGGVACLHRRCVNSDHLEAIPTHRENSLRAKQGRPLPPACQKGHLWPENYIVRGRQGICIECERERGRAYGRRKGARELDPNRCFKGHERTPENTYVRPDGWNECKTCKQEARAVRLAAGGKW